MNKGIEQWGSQGEKAAPPPQRPAVRNRTQKPFTKSPSQKQRKLPRQAPPLSIIMTIATI